MNISMRNATTVAATVALSLAAALTLSGCFGSQAEPPAPKAPESVVEETVAPTPETDAGDSSVSDSNAAWLPLGFPESIPLFEAAITGAKTDFEGTERKWTVIMAEVPDIEGTFATVAGQLTAAGFAEQITKFEGGNARGIYEGKGYSIFVNVLSDNGQPALGYIVSEMD